MSLVYLLVVVALQGPGPEPTLEGALSTMPPHQEQTRRGNRYWVYDKAGYRELIELSFDRILLKHANQLLKKKVEQLEADVEDLEKQAALSRKTAEIWESEYQRLRAKWEDDNKKLHEASLRANSPWPWVLVGVGAVSAAVGGVGVAVEHDNYWAYGLIGSGALVSILGLVDGLF